ncbi:uncharacterized protein LOC106156270 [Lingula anatina]|uniref:Uncharacterized protein LOC106156270 n=1 Tax=Lingula anatina TaxID=7574 RepID=A0A1S3HN32_LINAN|nr:uncharacterized protein LOC106156270 [Lingula anatina]|eukprot:XP_013386916.1 uncharacterized protein LOC106156270 [Lingula anatina]
MTETLISDAVNAGSMYSINRKTTGEYVLQADPKMAAEKGNFSHNPFHIFMIFFTVLSYAASCTFNALSVRSGPVSNVFFERNDTFRQNYIKYKLDINPAFYAFRIWWLIYFWQAVWLLYAVVSICRKGPDGYMYVKPTLVPFVTYFLFPFSNLCTIAWLLLIDRDARELSMIPLPLSTFALYVILWFSHRHLAETSQYLVGMGSCKDVWMVKVFFQNGLAIYATWSSIANLLSFANVLAYGPTIGVVSPEVSGSISLGILAAEVLIYFILDIFVFDKHLRHLFIVYPVVIWAVTGILVNNWDITKRNCVIGLVLLTVAVLMFLFKIGVIILHYRRKKHFRKSLDMNKRYKDAVPEPAKDTQF